MVLSGIVSPWQLPLQILHDRNWQSLAGQKEDVNSVDPENWTHDIRYLLCLLLLAKDPLNQDLRKPDRYLDICWRLCLPCCCFLLDR